MNPPDHISQDDLALFALQLLPEQEAAKVFAHLEGCEACRKQVAEFQGDLALYSLFAESQTPPVRAQERLTEQVAKEPRSALPLLQEADDLETEAPLPHHTGRLITMPELPERRSRSSVIQYLGWAVAAVFALAAFLQYQQRQAMGSEVAAAREQLAAVQSSASTSQTAVSTLTNPGALNVTLRQPSAQGSVAGPQGRAAYLPDRGALVFVATNMEPLKPYKVYELWLLPSKAGMLPIPAASFRPDASGSATVILPTGPKLVEVKGFGVTQEDDKSAPKQPTLPILLVGTSKS